MSSISKDSRSACLPSPPEPTEILERARESKTLYGFDFDGTLTPIVARPEDVRFDPLARKALMREEHGLRRLICTGRAVADVKTHLYASAVTDSKLPQGLDVIGNHGLEWCLHSTGAKDELRDLTPPGWQKWRDRFAQDLAREIQKRGGMIEDKRASFSLHYRHAGEEWWTGPEGEAWLGQAIAGHGKLIPGVAVWNILPLTPINKGEAMIRYAREHGFKRIVYFGDEPTDETVFERAQEVEEMIGVKVGEGPTAASYRVSNVQAVVDWLIRLDQAWSVIHVG